MGLVTSGGPTVRVRHGMIGEVAQELAGARVVDFTHGRVGAVLEREADETDSVELLGDCVTHWELAGETRRAFSAAMKLGYRLIGLGLGEEAERAFETAHRCSQSEDEQRLSIEGGIAAARLSWNWPRVLQPLFRSAISSFPAISHAMTPTFMWKPKPLCSAFAGKTNIETLYMRLPKTAAFTPGLYDFAALR